MQPQSPQTEAAPKKNRHFFLGAGLLIVFLAAIRSRSPLNP